jgi:GNAT superfamily N-acetyltransferase
MVEVRVIDIVDEASFALVPACADAGFDHRTCDYWEDADRGSKAARPGWLTGGPARPAPAVPNLEDDNPFRPSRAPAGGSGPEEAATIASALDPLDGDDLFATPAWNPFAPRPKGGSSAAAGGPRKLRLLDRGRGVFGSYAKALLADDVPAAYAQFGPLSAYPRALRQRELYPHLPQAPLPAVITCIATTAEARSRGHARRLVEAVCDDLAARGFAAVEAYPDETLRPDEASAASAAFWVACGFGVAAADVRYPVMRRDLG